MVSPFTDNPEKRVVREQWDTPLLEHLHSTYGVRYRYLGLPGTDLIDVKLWHHMIDEVIAFEPPDDADAGRTAIAHRTLTGEELGAETSEYGLFFSTEGGTDFEFRVYGKANGSVWFGGVSIEKIK